nr:hypothetical protein [Tanacetum cinerariifolium]
VIGPRPLISCCEAAWIRVDLFSGMLQSSDEESALLLSLLKRYRRKDVNSTLVTSVDRWIASQINFHIPSPVALIKACVKIQSKLIDGTNHAAPTIYYLFSHLTERNHKQQSGISFEQGNLFGHENRFGSGGNEFGRYRNNENKGVGSSRQEHGCHNCEDKGHFISAFPKPKENKVFFGDAWSDSEMVMDRKRMQHVS